MTAARTYWINRRRTLLLLALVLLAFTGAARADRTRLTVDVSRPGPKISPTLHGLFFEEINHAGDGGLYAEQVRNRSFEDAADSPEGWSLAIPGDGEARISLDDSRPLNAQNRRSLRLEIVRSGSSGVGVANAGYWGIAVEKGRAYRLSVYTRRSPEFTGSLSVSLEGPNGRKYAETRIRGAGTGWKRFEETLTARDSDASARLVIRASAPGTVWLDMVSLFPKNTWKNRPNGLRADLAGMMAALEPAFIRFPGGCFVEGDRLENAFRWKETIGDIAARPGRANLWGYRSTDGLGYHEYLQMCEDLRAEPLYVINCGMSHTNVVPMDKLDPWVQDALDAIEYANGPVTSRWGAQRARNGHPAPFNLKYLQIGNENGGPAYNERYARFYDAVKARYPNIRIIANVWGGRPTSRPADFLDEHYYSSAEWFASQTHRYDSYDRKGPKIYIGEYAVTQNAGHGNLRAALGEAAFMTGLERNADIVAMASYAPLFVNVHDRKWNPDAIVFDVSRAYGTPSYHVQKLFRAHQGDVVLPSTVASETPPPTPTGAIGVGTWRTQAEFKDIRLSRGKETLFASDFARDAPDWRIVRGDWKIQNGAFQQSAPGENSRAVANVTASGDGVYTLRARKISGSEGFLVLFRARDDDNWIWWNLGGWNNTQHGLEKSAGGAKTMVSEAVPGSIETGRWYDIRIEMQNRRIRCYLDNKLIHDVEDRAPEPLSVVASHDTGRGEIVLKVVNFTERAQETDVTLQGTGRVAAKGTAITLTSQKMTDENSVAEPTKVAPVTRTEQGFGKAFHYTFAPRSLTILRITASP